MLTQVLNNCLVYLLGICYFLNMSWWCVAFPISGWGSSFNVITEAWSEKEENRKMFPINQNAYPSNSSITQLWSDKRKEKIKSGRLILTRVYMREWMKMSHLNSGSVIKVSPLSRLPYFHLYFYFPTFWIARIFSTDSIHLDTVWHWPAISNTHEVHVNIRHFCGYSERLKVRYFPKVKKYPHKSL